MKSKSSSPVTLSDLARFTILSIKKGSAKKQFVFHGAFTHLEGVREEQPLGFLYISRRNSIYGELSEFNRKTKTATFLAWPITRKLRIGDSLPYVDYYWSPAEVARALEPASFWRKLIFKPVHMVRYRDPAVPGWWKSHTLDQKITKGATDVHFIENGWDHENCYLCRARIGRKGERSGYFKKSENQWLCIFCYKNFIARHDLSFLQFKK